MIIGWPIYKRGMMGGMKQPSVNVDEITYPGDQRSCGYDGFANIWHKILGVYPVLEGDWSLEDA